jgi:hypothetical protein
VLAPECEMVAGNVTIVSQILQQCLKIVVYGLDAVDCHGWERLSELMHRLAPIRPDVDNRRDRETAIGLYLSSSCGHVHASCKCVCEIAAQSVA